jgi:hypothetical protein
MKLLRHAAVQNGRARPGVDHEIQVPQGTGGTARDNQIVPVELKSYRLFRRKRLTSGCENRQKA